MGPQTSDLDKYRSCRHGGTRRISPCYSGAFSALTFRDFRNHHQNISRLLNVLGFDTGRSWRLGAYVELPRVRAYLPFLVSANQHIPNNTDTFSVNIICNI